MSDEDATLSYPTIHPSHFDLILIGTGLPESIIAAASSAVGKTVLHIDPNSFYGTHFSSLPLHDFISFLQSQRNIPSSTTIPTEYSPPSTTTTTTTVCGDKTYLVVDLKPHSLYSHIEISTHASPEDLQSSRKFNLDLSGPRVLFCADPTVDLLLKSGASHHVEFKSVDASLIYSERKDDKNKYELSNVPDSRSAIFKDKANLTVIEKSKLMRFFKLVQEHFESTTMENVGEENGRISDDDLETPFVNFLDKQSLPPKIKSIILYAISMADSDQISPERRGLIKTKDGMKSLILYHSSVGRFPNALGALIYPIYGQGELPQAFCRAAAVKGALYVLRMPVSALLFDKESKRYGGVKLASGQELSCHKLVVTPSFIVPSPTVLVPIQDLQQGSFDRSTLGEVYGQVARAVCITRSSIKPGVSNLLVVYPPRTLYLEQVASVRVLQLGSGLAVCPPGLFVLYLSAWCDEPVQGKESLHAALNALLSCTEEAPPTLLWSSMYIQKLVKGASEAITLCSMPDETLDYRDTLESTVELFHRMYPQEEFMRDTKAPVDTENDLSE